MTYGSMHRATREYVGTRLEQSNLTWAKLGVEPCMEIDERDKDSWAYCVLPHDHNEIGAPRNTRQHLFVVLGEALDIYQFSVICDGALDEEFCAVTDYEVNLADWLAEHCRLSITDGEIENFEIIVTNYVEEDAGEVRYRVSSWDD